jgi:guanylate kinase
MGALAIKNQYPEICRTIFIEAPSFEVLKQRLNARGTETEQSLQERISKAALELTFAPRFDAIIINDDLETATKDLMRTVDEFVKC